MKTNSLAGHAPGMAATDIVRTVTHQYDILGESPTWDARTGHLYWVDLRWQKLQRLHAATNRVESWSLPEVVGAVVARRSGGVVVALKSGLHGFDPQTEALTPLVTIEDHPETRLNDAKCDRAGRIWCGSMFDFGLQTTGALYRIDADLRVDTMRTKITIPNAIAFSPDGETLYFADTAAGHIERASFDADTGAIGPWTIFAEAGIAPGKPDGATVDAQGYVWNARYGGGCLVRLAPDGRLERTIRLPVSQPTSCAFGGPDMATLFVTTATQKLSAAQVQSEPLAGALLALDAGVRGLSEPGFEG